MQDHFDGAMTMCVLFCCYLIKQFNNGKRNPMQKNEIEKVYFSDNGVSYFKKLLKAPSTSIASPEYDDDNFDDTVKKLFLYASHLTHVINNKATTLQQASLNSWRLFYFGFWWSFFFATNTTAPLTLPPLEKL